MKIKSWITVLFLLVAWAMPCIGQDAADILEHARPAVVTITTTDKKAGESSQGSGFIIRETGLVVTAFHVVADALTVTVKLADGHTYTAILLDQDTTKDYALMKIDATGLPTLPVGDPAKMRQGDKVYTLGSPEGLEQTASEGIVSAIRQDPEKGMLIQTTAPISSGNSGGPLLNACGEVIGITLFKLKDGQALDFALAINQVDVSAIDAVTDASVSPEALFDAGKHERTLAERAGDEGREHQKTAYKAEQNDDFDGKKREMELADAAHAQESQHYKRAFALFKLAEVQKPEWPDLLYQLGRFSPDTKASIQYFQRCVKVKEDYADAWYELAGCLTPFDVKDLKDTGAWSRAADCYKKAILYADNLTLTIDLSGIHIGKVTIGQTSYDSRVTPLKSARWFLYQRAADALDSAHRYREAAHMHERVAEAVTRFNKLIITTNGRDRSLHSCQEYLRAGMDYDLLGEHANALASFERGVNMSKDKGAAYYMLGNMLQSPADAFGWFGTYPAPLCAEAVAGSGGY
jgi:tetratricopeptide (TPR) repeat protein